MTTANRPGNFVLFRLCSVVFPIVVLCCANPEEDTVAAALRRLSTGKGDLANLSVTYDDMHGLWGGLTLQIRGDGTVNQQAVRQAAGEPRKVTREDLLKLVALLIKHQAWEQRVPDRRRLQDESRAHLTIAYESQTAEIWEWYNDLEKNNRILEVRNLMEHIAWGKPPKKN